MTVEATARKMTIAQRKAFDALLHQMRQRIYTTGYHIENKIRDKMVAEAEGHSTTPELKALLSEYTLVHKEYTALGKKLQTVANKVSLKGCTLSNAPTGSSSKFSLKVNTGSPQFNRLFRERKAALARLTTPNGDDTTKYSVRIWASDTVDEAKAIMAEYEAYIEGKLTELRAITG